MGFNLSQTIYIFTLLTLILNCLNCGPFKLTFESFWYAPPLWGLCSFLPPLPPGLKTPHQAFLFTPFIPLGLCWHPTLGCPHKWVASSVWAVTPHVRPPTPLHWCPPYPRSIWVGSIPYARPPSLDAYFAVPHITSLGLNCSGKERKDINF